MGSGISAVIDTCIYRPVKKPPPGVIYHRDMMKMLDSFYRTEAQKKFHNACIDSFLYHIYGKEYFECYFEQIEEEISSIELKHAIDFDINQMQSISMLIAAMLYSIPDISITFLSPDARSAAIILDQVVHFFGLLPESKNISSKKDDENFFVNNNATISRFCSCCTKINDPCDQVIFSLGVLKRDLLYILDLDLSKTNTIFHFHPYESHEKP